VLEQRRWTLLFVVVVCAVPLVLAPTWPLENQPSPDAQDYVAAADDLLGADVRYPPGWPLVIAMFGRTLAPKVAVLVLYLLVVALAVRLGGRRAGMVAAGLCVVSPFLNASSSFAMSDATGAATAVGAVLLASRPAAAGIVAGFGALVRVAAVGWIGTLVLAIRSRRFFVCAATGVLLMVVWQSFHSYPAGQSEFAARYLWEVPVWGDSRWYAVGFPPVLPPSPPEAPHFVIYALTLVWYWVFTLPLVGLVGFAEVWRRRREEIGRAALAVIVGNVAIFLPFYFQSPRFLAPAGMLLVAFAASGAVRFVAYWGERRRGSPRLRPMVLVGLTGGIGSGKSTVSRLLEQRGAVIIDADAIVRELQEPGQPVFEQMVERFGARVVAPDGGLDRQAVADVVFHDEQALKDLNAITHPEVGKEIARRLSEEAATDHVVVLDIPLMVEGGRYGVELLLVVDVEEEIAIQRLVAQRGMGEEDIRARIGRQATREQRREKADIVIDNSGSLQDLERRVDEAWRRIEELRHSRTA